MKYHNFFHYLTNSDEKKNHEVFLERIIVNQEHNTKCQFGYRDSIFGKKCAMVEMQLDK